VIGAASLKLFPRPAAMATAFVGLADPRAALRLLTLARRLLGAGVTGFELLPRIGLEFVVRHVPGARDPLTSRHDWYVLIELSSQLPDGLEGALSDLLQAAMEQEIIEDAVIASTLEQRRAFWRLREELSDVQRDEGGSIKHDVSAPVGATPDFIAQASRAVLDFLPGARIVAFGHLGDGNIHFNVSQPIGADQQAFMARWEEVNEIVHAIVNRYGGSISAEHGIGRLKRELLQKTKDPVALAVMRAIKATLDPNGILNPGAVL
jgi:FAD/FMN-containing dehydrogenase